jgi:hypothetical protein
MGIIERLFYVWAGGLVILVSGALLWRYFGPPVLQIFPPDIDIGENRPQGLEFTASNFGTYELINIERNDSGQWVVITPTPIRGNIWGYVDYRSPAMVAPNQPGFIGTAL